MKDIRKDIDKYLKRLKSGEKCFNEFYKFSSGYVQYLAYRYLVDKSFVDDVVVNAFTCMARSIEHLDESKNGYGWLCRITRNEAYKINIRERRPEAQIDETVEQIADEKDRIDYLSGKYDIERAIESLDELNRKIVEMRFFDLKTFREIGDELNIPTSTAYKTYQKSLKQIIEILEN